MWVAFDAWSNRFAEHVARKGKIEAGTYRAFGYKASTHGVDDLKLKWREIRIGLHHAPEGSSPAIQDELGLNRDATLQPKKSEGEKLRE